jgi:hypothetical protein
MLFHLFHFSLFCGDTPKQWEKKELRLRLIWILWVPSIKETVTVRSCKVGESLVCCVVCNASLH